MDKMRFKMEVKPDRIFLAMVLAITSLLPYTFILLDSDSSFLYRDLTNVFIPAKAIWLRAVQNFGYVPHWNPYLSGGLPYLADLGHAPLYPMNFIFLLFGFDRLPHAVVWFVALHHAILAVGAFFLFLELKCEKNTSFFLSLACAWCGSIFSTMSFCHEIGAFAALPWFFLFSLRASRKAIFSLDQALASMALAWQIYAGNPQFAYISGIFSLILLWRDGKGRSLGRFFVLIFLTVLASAPQILPTLAALSSFRREYEDLPLAYQYHFQTAWSLHPLRIFEFIFPHAFTRDLTSPGWAQNLLHVSNQTAPFLFSHYCSAALLFPFLLGLTFWRRNFQHEKGRILATAIFLLLICLLAFGEKSPIPLYRWAIDFLPFWRHFRYPERLMPWISLAWLLAAGISLDRAIRIHAPKKAFIFPVLIAISLAFLFLWNFAGTASGEKSAIRGITLILLSSFLIYFSRRFRTAGIVALLLPSMDLLIHSQSLLWPESGSILKAAGPLYAEKIQKDLRQSEEEIKKGASHRLLVVDHLGGFKQQNLPLLTSSESAAKWEFLLFNTPAYWEIESITGNLNLKPAFSLFEASGEPEFKRRAADLMGARYLLFLEPQGNSLKRNPSVVPYAFSPKQVSWLGSETDVLKKIHEPHWNYHEEILLTGENSLLKNPSKFQWKINKVEKHFDQISLELSPSQEPGSGWVTINESFSRNWVLRDNFGNKIPIFKANAWSLAFPMPTYDRKPASVLVTLEYRDISFQIGLFCFFGWLILFLGFLLFDPSVRVAKRPVQPK